MQNILILSILKIAPKTNVIYFLNLLLTRTPPVRKWFKIKKENKKKRKAVNLSVKVFSTNVIIGDTILTSTTANLRGHASEPCKRLAISSRAKVIPSFVSHFKILSIGPTPGIELLTSHSAVKHSTNGANPTTIEIKFT